MHAYLLSSLLFSATTLAGTVLPGIPWYDTDGQLLQAHGGGIVQEGDTFYLIGENKTSREGNEGGNYFNSVACYKSQDLLAWEFVNDLLVHDPSIPDLAENRIIERPKVVHNPSTNQYVMWMHVDSSDYKDARAGHAVADSLCGDYTYEGSVRPLDNQSRDMTFFVDDDGTGYLVGEDRDEGTHFFRLSNDYRNVEEKVGTISFSWMPALESPAVAKVDGVYYFFGSQLTGWNPNENQFTTADSLAGPWAPPGRFFPWGSGTCSSQTTFILPINGKHMYMGDRWFSERLWESQYIWLPLELDSQARTASMYCLDSWDTSEVGLLDEVEVDKYEDDMLAVVLRPYPALGAINNTTRQASSEVLGFARGELLSGISKNDACWRKPQPASWQRVLENRDGALSKPSVVIYRSIVSDCPGSVIDANTRVPFEQKIPESGYARAIFGILLDAELMADREIGKEVMIIAKRGTGIDYEEKKDSPFIAGDIRPQMPGRTWKEIRYRCIDHVAGSDEEDSLLNYDEEDQEPTEVDAYQDVDQYVWSPLHFEID